jgi:integrase
MGEGSVFERGDGRWCAKYRDARGRWRYVYRKTRNEARKALRQELKDRDEGISTDGAATVGTLLDEWLASVKDDVSLRTWLGYEGIVRVHLKPGLEDKRLDKLNPKDVRGILREKLDAGLSPVRVRRIRLTLKMALDEALRMRYVRRNVAAEVRAPKLHSPEMEVLTIEQVKTLIRAARGDKLECVYVLAATCGVRQGEVLALRYEDIDFDKGTLRIRRTVWRNNVYPPKTRNCIRTIKLPNIALEALVRHRESNGGSGWLFATRNGNPVDASNFIHRPWKRLLRKAGLPENTKFHALRHGAASIMLAKNTPLPVVSRMLGHANPNITATIYAHVIQGMEGMAAGAMDEALG